MCGKEFQKMGKDLVNGTEAQAGEELRLKSSPLESSHFLLPFLSESLMWKMRVDSFNKMEAPQVRSLGLHLPTLILLASVSTVAR